MVHSLFQTSPHFIVTTRFPVGALPAALGSPYVSLRSLPSWTWVWPTIASHPHAYRLFALLPSDALHQALRALGWLLMQRLHLLPVEPSCYLLGHTLGGGAEL